ncbi:MAG: NAD(P)-dependent oxidoreductase [Thiomicrospira sp.]|nr:NAD(P)-dependent oxidoreductase [Thiomicrospira sp.]
MQVAISGANGMIGRHLSVFLQQHQQACKKLTRADWDLNQWQTVAQFDALFAGCEAVFHFAATLPQAAQTEDSLALKTLFDTNVRACMNLADWACSRGVPLVFISSATVYADAHAADIHEQAALSGLGFGGQYGYSKYLAESIFEHYRAQGLAVIILRPSSVYGHGLPKDKLLAKLLARAQADETLSLSEGENRINLIHAADVARAAWLAYQQQAWGVYNLSGQVYSVADMARTALEVAGSGQLQLTSAGGYTPFVRFDLNGDLARERFGFQAQIDLTQGLSLMRDKKEWLC